ncbi:MAG: uroporphyrinogen-III C-methyltransferase, partial [Enhydrobacter sp.]
MTKPQTATEPSESILINDSENKSPPVNTPSCHCHCRSWFFITLISVGLLASALFIQIKQLKITENRQADYFQGILASLSTQQQQIKAHMENSLTELETKQTTVQSQFKTLNRQVEVTLDIEQDQLEPFLLQKAQYYLDLAAINAHWSNNQESSLALLKEVNQVLNKITDPGVETIKQSITTDIEHLETLTSIDTTYLIKRLNVAQTTLEKLPFQSTTDDASKAQAGISSWREGLQRSLSLLKQVVIVHRHNEQELPLLSPLYQTILKERIGMALQEAQWGILQNNEPVYQEALQQAIEGIQRCFSTQDKATQNLLTDLKQLKDTSLIIKKPNFDQSRSALNQLIDAKTTYQTNEKRIAA